MRKVTVVVGVFPGERGLFLHGQVSQKVHLKEEKTLIPMVPLFGTFFCRNLSGKVAESHKTGEWGRDRSGKARCTGRCYRRHGKDRPRSPRICSRIRRSAQQKKENFTGFPSVRLLTLPTSEMSTHFCLFSTGVGTSAHASPVRRHLTGHHYNTGKLGSQGFQNTNTEVQSSIAGLELSSEDSASQALQIGRKR